ncbi:hypothetical protein VNO77_19871 [Canavalia gladiata]|uniref:Uncharacterized protein n=1 Tax=Canavalia gladiata TaxID=3824 RepID=A0AAN9QLV4_CANGL
MSGHSVWEGLRRIKVLTFRHAGPTIVGRTQSCHVRKGLWKGLSWPMLVEIVSGPPHHLILKVSRGCDSIRLDPNLKLFSASPRSGKVMPKGKNHANKKVLSSVKDLNLREIRLQGADKYDTYACMSLQQIGYGSKDVQIGCRTSKNFYDLLGSFVSHIVNGPLKIAKSYSAKLMAYEAMLTMKSNME